jgi:hypothetical protein
MINDGGGGGGDGFVAERFKSLKNLCMFADRASQYISIVKPT